MGSGASAETARTTVAHLLTGKPADASDIKVNFQFLAKRVFSHTNRCAYYVHVRTWSKRVLKSEIYVESLVIFKIN
jgi:uncharacterized membrane protein